MWGELGSNVLHIVLPIVATMAASVLTRLLVQQVAKAGIEVNEKQQQQLRQIVFDAVTRTEEVARRNPDMTGPEKEAQAIEIARDKAPNATVEEIKHFIDVALPNLRRQGIGVTVAR